MEFFIIRETHLKHESDWFSSFAFLTIAERRDRLWKFSILNNFENFCVIIIDWDSLKIVLEIDTFAC